MKRSLNSQETNNARNISATKRDQLAKGCFGRGESRSRVSRFWIAKIRTKILDIRRGRTHASEINFILNTLDNG